MPGISEKQQAGQYGAIRGNKRPDHIRNMIFTLSYMGSHKRVVSRGVKCSDLYFIRITLVTRLRIGCRE